MTSSIAPGLPGDRILRALGRYHLLMREQMTRLLYRPTSTTFVGEHLTRLTRDGYLRMERMPLALPVGGTPGYWTLREPGRRYVQEAGIEVSRGAQRPMTSPYHLWHLAELNDALIAFELLCRADERLVLDELRHDRELRQNAPRIVLSDGRVTTVIPDAWVNLTVSGVPMGIALELDRGTEDECQWRRKLAGLLALAAGPYQDAFRADSMTVAIIATGGTRRSAELRRWTETELLRLGKPHWGDLFWITAAVPARIDPATLYVGARWTRPFDPVPRPLISDGVGCVDD
jgi:Replication-relaxation